MHETIIANKIIEKAKEHGKVKKVVIEVGDLANLPAFEMEEVMKKMTDWKIEIRPAKAEIKCKCGYKGEPKIIERAHDFVIYECPECKKMPAEVLKGDEIILKQVEVE